MQQHPWDLPEHDAEGQDGERVAGEKKMLVPGDEVRVAHHLGDGRRQQGGIAEPGHRRKKGSAEALPPDDRGDDRLLAIGNDEIELLQNFEEFGHVDRLAVLLLIPGCRLVRRISFVHAPYQCRAIRRKYAVRINVRSAYRYILSILEKGERIESKWLVEIGLRVGHLCSPYDGVRCRPSPWPAVAGTAHALCDGCGFPCYTWAMPWQ